MSNTTYNKPIPPEVNRPPVGTEERSVDKDKVKIK